LKKIGVVGLGKLGLPLAALFANEGHAVTAYDKNEDLMTALRIGTYKTAEPRLLESLKNAAKNLTLVNNIEEVVTTSDLIFIIVPTPSLISGEFSNEYLIEVLHEIGNSIRNRTRPIVVDIVSTVMPGSCDGLLRGTLEESSNKKIGSLLGLCYNPEFIALGSVIHDMQYPDMLLIGESDAWAGDVVEDALRTITKNSPTSRRMSLIEAELVKIAINNFVTMKISYANGLFQVAQRLGGIDIDIVTDAIGLDSRIGRKYLKGAAPYGGPCFPRDTRALSFLYAQLGLSDALSRATEEINDEHVEFVSQLVRDKANAIKNIGILGVSYKAGTPVIEESPGVAIAQHFINQKFNVYSYDDEGAAVPGQYSNYTICGDLVDLFGMCDLVVITRLFDNPDLLYTELIKSNVQYIDLWRQFPLKH